MIEEIVFCASAGFASALHIAGRTVATIAVSSCTMELKHA